MPKVFNHEIQEGDVLKTNLRGIGPIRSFVFTGETFENCNGLQLRCIEKESGRKLPDPHHKSFRTPEKVEKSIGLGGMLKDKDGNIIFDRFYGRASV